jgi:hypothetical protein
VLARAQVLAERLLDLIESTTARPLTNDTDSNTDADGAAGWTEEWGPLPEAMGEPSLILSPSSLGDSTGTDVDPPGRPTAQETEEPLPPEPSLLERPPVRWDALEVSLHGDVTVRRQLCLDLNFVVGADNDHCHLDGPFMDDRANVIGPFGGYGFAVTVFPGMLRRTDSQPWWGHIGFHGEYNRGLSEFDRRPTHKVVLDYRPGGDDPDPPYKIDMVQQDFKLHLLGRVPFPRRQESHLLLALGAGLYQVALDQSDYPDDAKLDREDRPSNPYLPTFTYLTLDLGVTVKVALARWVFPFVSVLGRYGVDKGYYPLSQASRVFGARNNVLAVEGELGLQFRLPRGFRITASGQVLWFRTYYATDNRQRLRTNEQGIWDVDPVFGSRADDLVVRTRLALGWAY